jgi:hypothetical protein
MKFIRFLTSKFDHELNCWDLCEEHPVAVLFAGDPAHPDPEVLAQLQKRTLTILSAGRFLSARDKHALEMFAALQSWSVLLLCLRFGTIFKDASSKTEQNHQGLPREEN